MAPSYSGVYLDVIASSCDFNGSPVDLGQLIISCIFLVVFVLIGVFWLGEVKKYLGRGASPKFPVFGFTLALVAAFINYVLYIVYSILLHCTQSYDAEVGVYIGSFVAAEIQDLLNLGIVLLYVIPNSVPLSKTARYANIVILAVIVILFIPFVIVDSLYYNGGFEDYSIVLSMSTAALNLAAAYYFLFLCTATYGACILLFYQYIQSQGSNSIKTKHWTVVAVSYLFIQRLLVVIATFAWNLPNTEVIIPDGAVIAFYVLTSTASAASFFAIAMTTL